MSRPILLLLCLLLAPTLVAAQASPPAFQEGQHYTRLNPPAPRLGTGEGVEVVEVFTYGCAACAYLNPLLTSWKAAGGANGTDWVSLPASFNPYWELLARVFYTVQTLGVQEQVHQALFDQIHRRNQPLQTLEEAADFLATQGVDREEFLAVARSFATDSRINRGKSALRAYRVEATPTVIVAGRWVVTGPSAGSYENLGTVLDYLIARERNAASAE